GCNPTSSKFIHTWLRFGEIMRGSLSAVWPLNWITDPNQRIYGAAFLGVLICWGIKVIFTKYKNSQKKSI
ncbi:hypothetical protein, partial [Citrobacter braakii]|uniref:hypothetical protein n=1 Tax=Citrobacter braakii TaxID=57706 RepID=UPI001C7D571F